MFAMSYLVKSILINIMYQINSSNNQKFMNYGKQISKKNEGKKGNAQLRPRKE